MKRLARNGKRALLVLFDIVVLCLSIIGAFWIRLGWPIDAEYIDFLRTYLIAFLIVKIAIFYGFGMYRRLWRYASFQELKIIVQAVISSSLMILFLSYTLGTLPIPRSVLIIDGLLTLMTVGGVRLSRRSLSELRLYRRTPADSRRILIVGAGNAGAMLVREMQKNSSLGLVPVGFVDDDPHKKMMNIHGIKVWGPRSGLPDIIETNLPDEVIIAMPSISRQVNDEVVNVCNQAGVRCRTVPGLYELIDGQIGIDQVRDVRIEDILGREPVVVNPRELRDFIRDRVVLVTGAGGSIGSELCRQITHFQPSAVILFDIAENSLFEIEQELLAKRDGCGVVAAIGDIKDKRRVEEVLLTHRPQLVFHAAAYKHVPMMETNPRLALENNFLGTMTLAQAAADHLVEKFVLISTDKAVNPLSMMGISKSLAEKTVLSLESGSTDFIVVRFGNVLGSNGSVVPIFQKQIAAGGPVTVTHPDMKRYLMTIPESVQLVLQAAAFGKAGDLFMLDMGDQVSIVELAQKLIKLSGVEPEAIDIEYIGMRPGEKLEEELVASTENRCPSPHPKIYKLRDDIFDADRLREGVRELAYLAGQGDVDMVLTKLPSLIGSDLSVTMK